MIFGRRHFEEVNFDRMCNVSVPQVVHADLKLRDLDLLEPVTSQMAGSRSIVTCRSQIYCSLTHCRSDSQVSQCLRESLTPLTEILAGVEVRAIQR